MTREEEEGKNVMNKMKVMYIIKKQGRVKGREGRGRKSLKWGGKGGKRFVLKRIRSEKWDCARGSDVDLL